MANVRPGSVVLVRFPFSDLSSTKLRPAVVVAPAGGVDWILCQVTSNPYGDPAAVALRAESFASGTLHRDSFARPGKLFTASEAIVVRVAATLSASAHRSVVEAVVRVVNAGLS